MSSTPKAPVASRNKRSANELLSRTRHLRVKPHTVLAIDLLLQESYVDLNAVTEVLSNDPGAMMCVLGMLAEDCAEDSPVCERIVDWISNLDLHDLLLELSAHLEFQKEQIDALHALPSA